MKFVCYTEAICRKLWDTENERMMKCERLRKLVFNVMIRTSVQDVSGRFEVRLHYSDNYRVQHVESIV